MRMMLILNYLLAQLIT